MVFGNPENLTPKEFELTVKAWCESKAGALESFEASHREHLQGVDGEYEIDVVVRHTILDGAKILTLIECKKHKNPIKREVVQALNDKVRSVGGHKGIIVATVSFQEGAREYAATHNIGLITVVNGSMAYIQASAGPRPRQLPPDIPAFAGWIEYPATDGQLGFQIFNVKHPFAFHELLGID